VTVHFSYGTCTGLFYFNFCWLHRCQLLTGVSYSQVSVTHRCQLLIGVSLLQRTLLQCRQQLSMTQLPFVVPQSPAPSTAESTTELQSPRSVPQPVQQLTAQQVQALFQQQQSVQLPRQQLTQVFSQQDSPVDITDKQVYLTTPDGKMTAYKVILHTGKGSLKYCIYAVCKCVYDFYCSHTEYCCIV